MNCIMLFESHCRRLRQKESQRVRRVTTVVLNLCVGAVLLFFFRCFGTVNAFAGFGKETPAESGRSLGLAGKLGVKFNAGSTSSLTLERDGREYVVDLVARSVREVNAASVVRPTSLEESQSPQPPTGNSTRGRKIFVEKCSFCHGADQEHCFVAFRQARGGDRNESQGGRSEVKQGG